LIDTIDEIHPANCHFNGRLAKIAIDPDQTASEKLSWIERPGEE
jgi:hypothetical protein